jgi:Big-like domain-containing protein
MSSRSLHALLGPTLLLAACSVLAPDRSANTVTLVLPATILVGDTVQARAEAKAENGKPALGDLTVTWSSSDPAAISVDATGRVTSATAGAHATISATVQHATGTLNVTVGDDQRLGYALADQPAAAGPYAPDPATSFNSSGGTVAVTRASAGVYAVRFAGLGRTSGQRDNVQTTGYGGAAGIFCKLGGWQSSGSDLVADVHCFTPAGAPADSKFTVLLSGARSYIPTSRLGFALVPEFSGGAINLDTSGTTRNNSSRTIVEVGHSGVGVFPMNFPGLGRVAGPQQGPETLQVTAVGPGPERCRIDAVDVSVYGLEVGCTTTGGVPADTRFSVLLLQRGRPAPTYRFGYAYADNPTSTVDYEPNPGFWRNNSGLSITARRVGTGQYRVVFLGQAKAPGATETILLTAFPDDRICTTTSWANSGVSDLAVTLSCFDPSGAPANARFNILMIQ